MKSNDLAPPHRKAAGLSRVEVSIDQRWKFGLDLPRIGARLKLDVTEAMLIEPVFPCVLRHGKGR